MLIKFYMSIISNLASETTYQHINTANKLHLALCVTALVTIHPFVPNLFITIECQQANTKIISSLNPLTLEAELNSFFRIKKICNNFNGPNECFLNRCGHSHICIGCHKVHPQTKCPSNGSLAKPLPESKNKHSPRNQTNNATRSVNTPKYLKIETVS